MKYILIIFLTILLGVVLYFSGCVYAPDYYNDNQYSKMEEKVDLIIQQHEQKLSCDDNNTCTQDLFDKNICHHQQIIPCCGNNTCEQTENENYFTCKKDCEYLKTDFENKIKLCNITNTCNQQAFTEKIGCIEELSQSNKNENCCFLIPKTFEDSNKEEYKIATNKCLTDYAITQSNSNTCFNAEYKKECFVCYIKNTHQNVFTTNICSDLNYDKKQFCLASILLDNKYCENIKNQKLKELCLKEEFSLNNCISYTLVDNSKISEQKYSTDEKELLENTYTRLDFFKRTEYDENKLIQNYKQKNSYKFSFNDTVDPSKPLENCSLNTKKPKIDYTNSSYSTFYFDYKDYHFVYSIKMYYDFYLYSKQLKDQYCFEFNEKESYKRYLKDKFNTAILEKISQDFNNLHKYGFSDSEIFEVVVRFVQEIPYNYIWEKKNVYPYEALYLMRGVCLDKALILAKILGLLGYETYIASGIADYTGSKLTHAVVSVPCEISNIIYNDKSMCLIESTHSYLINELEITNKLDFQKISEGKKYTEANYGPNKVKELKEYDIKIDILGKEITENKNKQDWNAYNNAVLEYNNYLYKTLKIRFENYS